MGVVGSSAPWPGLFIDSLPPDAQECTLKVQDGRFKLQDLLVVPMQRVLKYHLLLKVRPTPTPSAFVGCMRAEPTHRPRGDINKQTK